MNNKQIEEFIGVDRINRGKEQQRKKWYRHKLGRRKSHQEIIQIHKERVTNNPGCEKAKL